MICVTVCNPQLTPSTEAEEPLRKERSQYFDSTGQAINSSSPQSTHSCAKQRIWIYAWHASSWVGAKLHSREFTISSGELHQRNGKSTAFTPHLAGIQHEAAAFVSLLRACTKNKDLHRGNLIHYDILTRGLLTECSDALVTMYAKCGELGKARALLNTHTSRDVITWTALIAGYAREGLAQDALECFERMQYEGVSPNAVTYTCILKTCAGIGDVEKGKKIHDEVARQGLQDNLVLGTALVDMYAKCGSLSTAHDVLVKLSSRDVVAWNALISGYAQDDQGKKALHCFDRMQQEGIPPDHVTYLCILKACASTGALDRGKEIHNVIASQGLLQNNIALGSALVDMYAKCGALSKAQDVLEKLPSRDVVFWSALIAGYAQEGQGELALKCFERMQAEGIPPNAVTYASILKACAIIKAEDKGKQIHDEIERQGLGSSLVFMYARCGALSKARAVLDKLPLQDVVTWNALLAGYVQEGQGEQALNCFRHMKCEGILPNAETYACILKACAAVGAIDKGKQIHDEIARQGLLQDNIVLGSSLVDMYAKCSDLSKAQDVLEKLPVRDVVAWSALIAGYVQEGQGEQALNCFELMQLEGISPNVVTLGCILNACSHLGLVEKGHTFFVDMSTRYSIKPNMECYTCMIDLFGRAGHLERVAELVKEMSSSDCPAIWLVLLAACQKFGDVNLGRWAFEKAVEVDKSDGAAYVLMANIYAASGMQEDANGIETMRIQNKAQTKPG